MSISDRDRLVLQELEKDLLTDARSSSQLGTRAAGLLIASAGLVLGLLVLLVGLRLEDTIGTCVGVVGAAMIVATAWLGVHDLSLRRRSRLITGRPITGRADLRP